MKVVDIVPWGRNFEEYRRMFALTERELDMRILGCGDGPASFNAEMTRKGKKVISCDPLYEYHSDIIRSRVQDTYTLMAHKMKTSHYKYNWDLYGSVEALCDARMEAMELFFADYEKGKVRGRYVPAALPELPFDNKAFELSLVSHLLFLYSGNLGLHFHYASVSELLRVSEEVRIFPLIKLDGKESEHVDPLIRQFRLDGYSPEVVTVDYEFQKGANQMLVVR